MNTIQTTIASLLVVALLFSLPGLYFYTEGPAPSEGNNGSPVGNSNGSSAVNSSWNSAKLVDYEPVPMPSASKVAQTNFELSELSRGEKREILKKMMIDVNEADQSQLERVSGIGPATAKRIIQYREQNGSFGSIEDLDDVSGIESTDI